MKTTKHGYTLIEVILIIAVSALGAMGVYMAYNNLSLNKKVEIETSFIMDSIEKLDAIYNITGNFTNMHKSENLEKAGILNKGNGIELIGFNSNANQFSFKYNSTNAEACVKLVSKIGGSSYANQFALAGAEPLKTNSDINSITNSCQQRNEFEIIYSKNGIFKNLQNSATVTINSTSTTGIQPNITAPTNAPAIGTPTVGAIFSSDDSLPWRFSRIWDCITNLRCLGTNTYVEGTSTPLISISIGELTPPPPPTPTCLPPNVINASGICVMSCSYPLVLNEATNTCVNMPTECLRPSYIDASGTCVSPPTCAVDETLVSGVCTKNTVPGQGCAPVNYSLNSGTGTVCLFNVTAMSNNEQKTFWEHKIGFVGELTLVCKNGVLEKVAELCKFDDNFLADECVNIDGIQTTVPVGMTKEIINGLPNCFAPPPTCAANETLVNGVCTLNVIPPTPQQARCVGRTRGTAILNSGACFAPWVEYDLAHQETLTKPTYGIRCGSSNHGGSSTILGFTLTCNNGSITKISEPRPEEVDSPY